MTVPQRSDENAELRERIARALAQEDGRSSEMWDYYLDSAQVVLDVLGLEQVGRAFVGPAGRNIWAYPRARAHLVNGERIYRLSGASSSVEADGIPTEGDARE